MNRRHLLQSFGAGVGLASGGCLGRLTDGGSDGPPFELRVDDVRVQVETIDLDVDITDAEVTEDATATVETTCTNTGDEEDVVGVRPDDPTYWFSDESPPELALVPPQAFDLDRTTERCWEPAESLDDTLDGKSTTLQPGEAATVRYELWDTAVSEDQCLSPGTSRFVKRDWELTVELA